MAPPITSPATHDGMSKRLPQPRVRQACVRCRKQKLRCDNERPCALCVRSSAECVEAVQQPRKRARTINSKLSDALCNPPSEIHPSGSVSPETGARVVTALRLGETESGAIDSRSKVPERQEETTIPPQERTSTYGLVDQLFQKYDSASGLIPDANALPGGSPDQVSSARSHERMVPVSDLLGFELPSREVIDILFDTFRSGVHWFMMVFHEPSFKAELEEIISSGYMRPRRLSLLILLLLILGIGATYSTKETVERHCPGVDLISLQSKLMTKVEEKFLDVFDEGDIESVQVGILLGSVYLYHSRPKRSFVVLGATLKGAQAMGLHMESTWGSIDPIVREVRRRAWWALYVAEGFAAITYGRPGMVHDEDWKVNMPRNIDDTSATCPGFDSLELLENGTYEHVTILSYQRFKFKLYHIASRITRNVYFNKGATMQSVLEKVKSINNQLLEWEKSIPAELRLSSFSTESTDSNGDTVLKVFRLQALALQLSYDNIQLVLHRPLLAYDGLSTSNALSASGPRRSVHSAQSQGVHTASCPPRQDTDMFKTSKTQCWKSAMRTSRIGDYPKILKAARNTHASGYAGIQTFTAGVMLAIFALSNPLSAQAQQAKQAISRLIKMPKPLGYRTPISDQCGSILEEMVRLILAEEMKSLISDGELEDGEGTSAEVSGTASSPMAPRPPTMIRGSSGTCNTWPRHQSNITERSFNGNYQPSGENNGGSTYCPHPHLRIPSQMESNPDLLLSPNISYPASDSWTLTGNFNDALTSLQNVFRDNRVNGDGGRHVEPQYHASDHTQRPDYGYNPSSAISHSSPGGYFSGGVVGVLSDTGQSWLWDDSFQFT